MIKVIVSDMDGTLFAGHGETVFDLTKRNEEALKRVQEAGIDFFIASGRMISYSNYILKKYGFEKHILAGFNGAIIYDKGETPITYPLTKEIVQGIVSFVNTHWDYDGMMQVQSLHNERIFNNPGGLDLSAYDKESKLSDICTVYKDKTIEDYLEGNVEVIPMKMTVVLKDPNKASILFEQLKESFENILYITMSTPTCIELVNPLANKGIFIQYLMNTYQYKPYEIAVIGDSLNDIDMFYYSENCFAMEDGVEELKNRAQYIVKDVAQCIDICIKLNQATEG